MNLSGDLLAAELDRLDVRWVRGARSPAPADPAELLTGLAASPEARLRSAIIPLLLWRPHVSQAAPAAAQGLPARARTTLVCYYTAALLLQEKHAWRLAALGAETAPLPDHFSGELGISRAGGYDACLAALARRHVALTGETVNWLSTYEHAAESFLTRQERARQWSRSTQKPSGGS